MNVSVVMTTFNGELYIEKQLNSLLLQTRQPEEVLIFDDGSSDATVAMVNQFIKKNHLMNWKLKVNEVNLGFRENFIQGLQKSTGDIVFLCDQDDIWKPNKIDTMTQLMESNDSILSMACSFDLIDSKDQIIEKESQPGKSNHDLLDYDVEPEALFLVPWEYLLRKNYAQGCTMVVRRSVINKISEDQYRTLEHDWALSLIAASQRGCYFYNKTLIQYRIHDKNSIGLQTYNRKERLIHRMNQLQNEQKRIMFLEQFLNDNKEKKILESYKIYYQNRLECLQNHKINKTMLMYLIKKTKIKVTKRAIIGDLISILFH